MREREEITCNKGPSSMVQCTTGSLKSVIFLKLAAINVKLRQLPADITTLPETYLVNSVREHFKVLVGKSSEDVREHIIVTYNLQFSTHFYPK